MKPKLTQRQIDNIIRRNNAKFKRATAVQKRVLVAKDVLGRLDTRQIKPEMGTWVQSNKLISEPDDSALQPLIVGGASCTVCGLGGLAISCIAMQNNAVANDMTSLEEIGDCIQDGRTVPGGLSSVFSKSQLVLIENAFEQGSGYFANTFCELGRSAGFGNRFQNNTRRLRAIMENIIQNNGTFRP